MKKQKEDRTESKRKLVYPGYQLKGLRYESSHERFVVPWQMDRREEELINESNF